LSVITAVNALKILTKFGLFRFKINEIGKLFLLASKIMSSNFTKV